MDTMQGRVTNLLSEISIFDRLIYKNKSQHRCTSHFRKLQQVWRYLKLFKLTATEEQMKELSRHLQPQKASPFGKKTETKPVEIVLKGLLSMSRIIPEFNGPILNAAKEFAGLMRQTFFMPFSMTITAVMARIRSLSFEVLVDTVEAYNTLAGKREHGSQLAAFNKLRLNLPSALECKWDGVQFQVTESKADQSWFIEDRSPGDTPAPANKRKGKHQLPRTPVSQNQKEVTPPLTETKTDTPAKERTRKEKTVEAPAPSASTSPASVSQDQTEALNTDTLTPSATDPPAKERKRKRKTIETPQDQTEALNTAAATDPPVKERKRKHKTIEPSASASPAPTEALVSHDQTEALKTDPPVKERKKKRKTETAEPSASASSAHTEAPVSEDQTEAVKLHPRKRKHSADEASASACLPTAEPPVSENQKENKRKKKKPSKEASKFLDFIDKPSSKKVRASMRTRIRLLRKKIP